MSPRNGVAAEAGKAASAAPAPTRNSRLRILAPSRTDAANRPLSTRRRWEIDSGSLSGTMAKFSPARCSSTEIVGEKGEEVALGRFRGGRIIFQRHPHDFPAAAEGWVVETMGRVRIQQEPRVAYIGLCQPLAIRRRGHPVGCPDEDERGDGKTFVRDIGAGRIESRRGLEPAPLG